MGPVEETKERRGNDPMKGRREQKYTKTRKTKRHEEDKKKWQEWK